jgi:hypothetical protein
MGFLAPKPPALPPVPPLPTTASVQTPEEVAAIDAKSAEDAVAEQRRVAGYFGRQSTILAGGYDQKQNQLGAKTILGG